MKTKMKFFSYALVALTFVVASCSKEGDIGPIGPQGPQGEQGVQGPEGPQGPAGQNAVTQENAAGGQTEGENGENGEDGEDGVNGSDGENGQDGTNGEDGADGQDGSDGQDGADGQQGPKGEQGEQGPKGDTGDDGANGQDGNANVIASKWTKSEFVRNTLVPGLHQYSIKDTRITQEVLNGYAVLGYLSLNSNFQNVQQIPYETQLLGATYSFTQNFSLGSIRCQPTHQHHAQCP